MDIIEGERPGAEYQVRINVLRFIIFDAIHLCAAELTIDVKKHDPSRRRKKKFHLGQFAFEKWIEVEITEGFVVEQERPGDDEDCYKCLLHDST